MADENYGPETLVARAARAVREIQNAPGRPELWRGAAAIDGELKRTIEIAHPPFFLPGERPVIFVAADAERCRVLTAGSALGARIRLVYLPVGFQAIAGSKPARLAACGTPYSPRAWLPTVAGWLLYLRFMSSRIYDVYSYREAYSVKRAATVYAPEANTELMPAEQRAFDLLSLPKSAAVLEVGCGGGRATFALIRQGYRDITAFDSEPKFIALAKLAEGGAYRDRFSVLDVLDLGDQFGGRLFDVVFFSFNGLDFLYPYVLRERAVANMVRQLAEGGYLVLSSDNTLCINRHSLRVWSKNIFNVLLGRRYFMVDVSFGKLMKYFSTPGQIQKELERFGLQLEHTVPNVPFLFPFRDPGPYYVFKKVRQRQPAEPAIGESPTR